MIILKGNRGSGKTTELVKRSNKEWLYIICKDQQRLDVITEVADKLGLDIPYPITVHELPLKSIHIKSVLIDDIEDVLGCIINKEIDCVTTSCIVNNI